MIYVKKIQIPDLPTEKPRRLYIDLPRGYHSGEQRYPVLYMFDGHNVFYDSHATYGKSWGMKEYLEKQKPQLILVAVECNPEGFRRLFEYSPWDFSAPRPIGNVQGLGKVTMDWFTTVLKPEIDAAYRTLPDREHTMIGGSSMGGLMSLYRSHPLASPTRIYMDMGTGEIDKRRRALAGMFETAKELSKAGADVSANVIPGAIHNEAAWEKRIPDVFKYLFKEPS